MAQDLHLDSWLFWTIVYHKNDQWRRLGVTHLVLTRWWISFGLGGEMSSIVFVVADLVEGQLHAHDRAFIAEWSPAGKDDGEQ